MNTHGLYVAKSYKPKFTGTEDEMHAAVETLTPAERRKGWCISPLNPWPFEEGEAQRHASALWATVGISVLLFIAAAILQACSQ